MRREMLLGDASINQQALIDELTLIRPYILDLD